MAVSSYKAQVIQLPLSRDLTLIMQTTVHLMAVGDNASLHHVEISLVKEEIAQIAGHNILKKAVIQLTLEESNCLKAGLLSTDNVFNYTATFKSNHAKPTFEKLDERNIKPIDCPITLAKRSSCQGRMIRDYPNKLQRIFNVHRE